ncbi:MAG TPA: serine/threonine-protein kinase, partial [Polyangiaceae bacterium]|nr:serine/threonine-protein kinase [Polyangiaceae bacterium]
GSLLERLTVPEPNLPVGLSAPSTPPPASRTRDDRGPRTLDALRAQQEREEQLGDAQRLRLATSVGLLLWPLFFVTDWLMAGYVHRGSFAAYGGIRLADWAILALSALWLRQRREPSRALVVAVDTLFYGSASLAIALMCTLYGGLSSPYAAGIPVVLICRAAFVALPWRAGLVPVGVSALGYPLIVVGAALLRGELASAFSDAAAVSLFAFYNGLILTTLAATLIGGHAFWTVRRQVFEARNLGRYKLVRPIGRGGMGEVWVAHHTTLRRDVAVKILRTDRLSEVALRRFEREVEATTALSHPNTIRVLDYGDTEDGLWYYVMELLEGEDLAQTLAREGQLSAGRCLHIMLQVCGALGEAHGRGIVHRDIKPENVYLCHAGGLQDFVKVLDFGIAKRHEADASTKLTHADRVLGTPAYVSPEVAIGGEADARSDVYALGGLLYFLLTGTSPFEGQDARALLVANAFQAPVAPSARLGAPVDATLEALVMRCLSKDPADRFADAQELREALLSITLPADD